MPEQLDLEFEARAPLDCALVLDARDQLGRDVFRRGMAEGLRPIERRRGFVHPCLLDLVDAYAAVNRRWNETIDRIEAHDALISRRSAR